MAIASLKAFAGAQSSHRRSCLGHPAPSSRNARTRRLRRFSAASTYRYAQRLDTRGKNQSPIGVTGSCVSRIEELRESKRQIVQAAAPAASSVVAGWPVACLTRTSASTASCTSLPARAGSLDAAFVAAW